MTTVHNSNRKWVPALVAEAGLCCCRCALQVTPFPAGVTTQCTEPSANQAQFPVPWVTGHRSKVAGAHGIVKMTEQARTSIWVISLCKACTCSLRSIPALCLSNAAACWTYTSLPRATWLAVVNSQTPWRAHESISNIKQSLWRFWKTRLVWTYKGKQLFKTGKKKITITLF